MLAALPSGLSLQIRGLTGKDGRYLANENLVRDEEVEDYVFANTCVDVVNEGVYSFGGKPIEWGKVLIGDRVSLAIHVRVATYPEEMYTVPLKCLSRTCRKSFEWEIDLERMLRERTQKLSKEDCERVRRGDPFEFVIPSNGKKVFYKLKTGADAKRYNSIREHAKSSASKRARETQNDLVNGFVFFGATIEGVDPKSKEARQAFLEELPLGDINKMRIDMERHDCGVDTTIEVECPFCSLAWEIELPFGREFFAPSDPDRQRKRQRRITTDAGEETDE